MVSPSPSPAKRPSIRTIAKLAGVCSMTVSLSLRNDPKISKPTRDRIHGIAARIGYRPDPQLGKLMYYLRARQKPAFRSTLCALTTAERGALSVHASTIITGARQRAEALGYGLEVIYISDLAGKRKDIHRVLISRGIDGILLLPMATPRSFVEWINWNDFSVLAATYSVLAPQFHRVVPAQFGNTLQLCHELERAGYRRIGLAQMTSHDVIVHHAFAGGVCWQSMLGGTEFVRPCLYPKGDYAALRSWFKSERPDVIITAGEDEEGRVAKELGLRVPGPVGLVGAAVEPRKKGSYAGIWERPDEIGVRAIDMLTGMVLRGEKGIPSVPTTTIVEGRFFAGASLRRKPS